MALIGVTYSDFTYIFYCYGSQISFSSVSGIVNRSCDGVGIESAKLKALGLFGGESFKINVYVFGMFCG